MNISGKVIVVKDVQHINETFKKREFVLEVEDGEYSQKIQLEVMQDKCEVLNDVQVGQMLNVEFNLRGREWTNPQGEVKYFNTLQAWKIDKGANANNATTEPPVMPAMPTADGEEIPF